MTKFRAYTKVSGTKYLGEFEAETDGKNMHFIAYVKVSGTKYLGEFEAETAEEAKKLATQLEECYVSLCRSCADQCEDPEIFVESGEE